jgi:proline racemase
MKIRKTVSLVTAHAEGEVGNVLVGGVVDVPGRTAFEKMEYLRDSNDGLRRALLFEPRGSVCQAVNVLLPTANPNADMAFVIMEATKYPAMSGSNTMCVATVILETGIRPMIEPETKLVLESPGGLIEARCTCRNGKVERVTLRMLPSFVLERDVSLDVEGYDRLSVTIAYGGIFYAIVDAEALGLQLDAPSARALATAGIAIRDAVNRTIDAVHPENPKIRRVANVIIAGKMERGASGVLETVSATVIGNGRLDRSPCGTGVCARMALLHQDGVLDVGQTVIHHSIFGTNYRGQILGEATVGGLPAIHPEISGRAWVTGLYNVFIEPDDPLAHGHCPSDVWISQG